MFANRINGIQTINAPSNPVPGEFTLFSTGNSIKVNGQDARCHDFLICDIDGICQVDGLRLASDRSACLPEETDAVDRLGAEVAGQSLEWKWEGLRVASVVDPGWQQDLKRHPLELAIKECLPYLRNVFHRPIRHLRIETESVLTAKVRRLATGAPDYLAAHPEDWDGRTVLGVKPKRVLAKVSHEELDIYENRLAARLIDHLSLFLARRIRRLREIEGMLAAVGDFGQQLRGSHWQQHRISRLWGDAVQSSRSLHVAKDLQTKLIHLRVQLLGLMDTELYASVPRRAKVGGQLRITNILRNDPNYRFVAKLWQDWSVLAGEQPETEDKFYQRMQRVHCRHAQVAIMYVAKALVQLGFTEVSRDNDLMQSGNEVVVTRGDEPRISISLQSQEDKTILVRIDGETILRIAPLFFGFLDVITERTAVAYMEALDARAPKDVQSLVIFPGSLSTGRSVLSENLQRRLLFTTTGPRTDVGGIKFLPVSPYDITSTERLARCLRWFIYSRHFLQYPFLFSIKSWGILGRHGLLIAAQNALRNADGGVCIKSIADAEHLTRAANVKCQELEREVSAIEDTVTKLERAMQAKNHDPSLRGRVRTIREKAKNASAFMAELDPLQKELRKAVSYTRSVMTCPCCDEVNAGTVGVVMRENGTFGVRCDSCECEWGLHLCGGCHERFPYIQISGVEGSLDGKNGLGWEEMSVGQDMLATPRLQADGSVRFECPWCGYV